MGCRCGLWCKYFVSRVYSLKSVIPLDCMNTNIHRYRQGIPHLGCAHMRHHKGNRVRHFFFFLILHSSFLIDMLPKLWVPIGPDVYVLDWQNSESDHQMFVSKNCSDGRDETHQIKKFHTQYKTDCYEVRTNICRELFSGNRKVVCPRVDPENDVRS